MTDPLSRWTLEKQEKPRDVFPSPEDALQTLPSALMHSTERANMFPSMSALYCCGVFMILAYMEAEAEGGSVGGKTDYLK